MDVEKIKNAKAKFAIAQFEAMKDMAELKALSAVSLQRPLDGEEYARMMDLGKKCIGFGVEK